MFSNIPQVTKNILILNGLFFLATFVLQNQGIDLIALFGAHYVNSPLFKPYQIITYFFMHSNTDILHIVFNMLLLVMFGSNLERIWGPKRFFIFYRKISNNFFFHAFYFISIFQWQQSIFLSKYNFFNVF